MNRSRRMLFVIAAGFLLLTSAVTAGLMQIGNAGQAHAASSFPSSYFAPYQDVTIGASLQSVAQATGQKYYTLAFITGNGCNADWAGTIPLNQTSIYLPNLDSDISYLRSQGGDIIISFGGAAGQELAQTCSTVSSLQAQYQAVINQYHATHLDFDIEGGEQGDSTTYTRRNTALAALQAANPGLTISFTLPSATTGLLSDSLGLLNNAVSHGVNFNIVNLMTMDYGSPDSQMGQESINAANGLHSELQSIFPSKSSSQLWAMVGITPMIGQNDSGGEVFSLSNASQVLSFAQTNKIGELAFWEVPRDNGNCAGSTTASDTCSGLSQSTYAFTNLWKPFTSGSSGGGSTPTPTPTQTKTPTPTPTQTQTPTPTPTPPTGGNLVSNAGFETGSLSSWTCQAGDSVVSSPVHSGSHALAMVPSSSTTGECDQTISVQPNHTYTLSAYVDGPYAYLGVQNGASNWTSSSSYTLLSVTFTTGASQSSATIYVHGWYAQGNVYVDDVSLS
ncbi:carbohydrate binding domain-containing protein [Ktedonobacter racemifer]|uniref:Chitinase n=1 Tax=Ktedonobacter racemifer DSM 44963 TaxID=485913 RepID=D6TYD7_KTERA|nr:carbohydrate binding domain-containing protein [Ktedonobacter racemifer]EFH83217.1 Chitinase [Ktedonobacter racemifer DSM 44963]